MGRARRAQAGRRLSFFAALSLLIVAWFATTALAWWAHYLALGPPSGARLIVMYLAIGGALSVAFRKWGPVLAFRGRAPEEEAARTFFAREDARSDDHKFERGLEP
jgi:hypothetical protein